MLEGSAPVAGAVDQSIPEPVLSTELAVQGGSGVWHSNAPDKAVPFARGPAPDKAVVPAPQYSARFFAATPEKAVLPCRTGWPY